MAMASSTVSRRRASSSGVGCTPMGMWKTKMELVPKELAKLDTLLLRPVMIDEMMMTVDTPMTTPRIVSVERRPLLRSEATAIAMVSRMFPKLTASFPSALR